MAHLASLLFTPIFFFFGISAALLMVFLAVEVLRYRKTYMTDHWSEEALLEDHIASGTLPTVTHAVMADRDPEMQTVRSAANRRSTGSRPTTVHAKQAS